MLWRPSAVPQCFRIFCKSLSEDGPESRLGYKLCSAHIQFIHYLVSPTFERKYLKIIIILTVFSYKNPNPVWVNYVGFGTLSFLGLTWETSLSELSRNEPLGWRPFSLPLQELFGWFGDTVGSQVTQQGLRPVSAPKPCPQGSDFKRGELRLSKLLL